jgi:hypothetical protein
VQKLGVYMPYGRHWLKCSLASNVSNAATRHEPDVAWEIPAGHQVFEVVFTSHAKEPLHIALIGPSEKPFHEQTLPALEGPCGLRLNVADYREALAYPGEVKLKDATRHLLHFRPPSPIELANVDIHQPGKLKNVNLRVWVESDAPPCLSVIETAGRHQDLSSGRFPSIGVFTGPKSLYGSCEYDEFFHPYDGSGRCNYRGAASD